MKNENHIQSDMNEEIRWHVIGHTDALDRLDSGDDGLTSGEAQIRLGRVGPNRLPEPAKPNPFLRFFKHFHNILIYVLLGSAVITGVLGHLTDTLVILAVVLANAAIGYIQEGKAEKAMDAIRSMLANKASVIRDGVRQAVDGESLVPGDIVFLEAGDKVPADLRLIQSSGLQIQEAILTGESVPTEKNVDPVSESAPVGDRKCMAYSGTMVTAGSGRGVIVGTGEGTEIGRISCMLSSVGTLTTPLIHQMNIFAKWLTMLILLIAGVLLVFGYFVEHFDFSELFMAVVGLSVAAIPEGLPAVLTITLAVGVQAMAKRNAIVRRLPAIETLGSVSVICTDKTGTLTRNEMMVASVATAQREFLISGNGYAPTGEIRLGNEAIAPDNYPVLRELARLAVHCNDASLSRRDNDGVWVVEGDPMEGALLAFAGKAGTDADDERGSWTRVDSIPFDSRHRFMATLNHCQESSQAFIALKGAPEQILEKCASQRTPENDAESIDKDYWHARADELASRGQRVLALAVKTVPADTRSIDFADLEDGLIIVGMLGLIDPPRSEAIQAISECHRAGIRVKMITGDHKGTASAIGRQIGLRNPGKVLTGADIEAMQDGALALAVMETDIFARTSPEHKLRLVMALQAQGMTVAMTGDGVNDAPALKRADAGIAMGLKGSEAAKEAAEFVLADDNFASIAAAVREGRTVYDNIKKVISWTLPTNAGEALSIIVALLFGMQMPITAVQILWVNLITAVTLGMALAFEPTEPDTMRRPPRPRDEPILTGGLVWQIIFASTLFLAGVFGIYAYAIDRGYSLELARTMAMNTLVVMELSYLFFIRNIYGNSLTWDAVKGTKVVWMTVIGVTLPQFAITYFPPFQGVFQTAAVPFADGVLIVLVGVVLFAIIETEKQLRLRVRKARN